MLNDLEATVWKIGLQRDFTFEKFRDVFSELDRDAVARLLDRALEQVLHSPAYGADLPYYDQLHVYSEGDFNLTLKTVGRRTELGEHLTASEFDLIVVNLTAESLEIPVYRTTIQRDALWQRPGPLDGPETVVIEPFGSHAFTAIAEIADLAAANREAPCFVVFSQARTSTTWVFERATLEPVGLTDNDLRSSRVQMAARVLGALGTAEDVATLENVARSDYMHFVRWEAAESVYNLDPARGTRLLNDHLVDDAHPSIRTAARRTLDAIRRDDPAAAV